MTLPSISPELLRAGDNRFLMRYIPMLGISLSEMDYLRGHRDDFFGDVIADQYDTTDVAGVGSVAATLQNNAHGGWMRLTAGAGAGRYSRLYLGAAADTYLTLDADGGWVMIVKWQASTVINSSMIFGAKNAGFARYCLAGYDSAVGANWGIWGGDGAASTTPATFGPVINTWYLMAMFVETDRARLWVNGTLAVDKITNIPHEVLTPVVYALSNGNAVNLDVDFWDVIPR